MGAEICGLGAAWVRRGSEAGWGEAASGAVCRRGLRRGAVSRPFRADDLLRALPPAHSPATTVFVDVDSAGYLVARGAGAGAGAGGAALCARAALAPNVHARTALLTHASGAACASAADSAATTLLQLRLEVDRAPHAALSVWLDERLRAALGVPHLALLNIRGEKEYACHLCGARFPEPNPLKAHLFLQCAAPAPCRFWRRVVARLQPAPPDPARLEALAAEWGRGRGGAGAHACLYCGKLYSRKYGLKIHIRTHTGYRPLRCGHCARAFGDPSNLNKHVRLHAARLECGVCGAALARRRDLERHLRAHARPLECDSSVNNKTRPLSIRAR